MFNSIDSCCIFYSEEVVHSPCTRIFSLLNMAAARYFSFFVSHKCAHARGSSGSSGNSFSSNS